MEGVGGEGKGKGRGCGECVRVVWRYSDEPLVCVLLGLLDGFFGGWRMASSLSSAVCYDVLLLN